MGQNKTRIAMLTPSSNSVVEPWCYKILSSFDNTSVHFSRVEVLKIDNDEESLSQFEDKNMLKGFDLLSHVRPEVIGWNGTSASWLGLERDRVLVNQINKRTGCPAVTSTLSIVKALRALQIENIGLVTPYVDSIQHKIIQNFNMEKINCVSERHFNMTDNFSFGEVTEATISNAALEVIDEGADAVIILCTNLAGASIGAKIEHETGVPVLDSVVLTIWGALYSIKKNTSPLFKWAPAISKIV